MENSLKDLTNSDIKKAYAQLLTEDQNRIDDLSLQLEMGLKARRPVKIGELGCHEILAKLGVFLNGISDTDKSIRASDLTERRI